jgi:epoxyqueuosine reductase
MPADVHTLTSATVKAEARRLGFDLCGVAPVADYPELKFLRQWLDAGYAGEMDYLKRSADRRADVRAIIPSAQSVVVLGTIYNTDRPYSNETDDPTHAAIARYAWGDDYHVVIEQRLTTLLDWMRTNGGSDFEGRAYVDTGPVQERVYAQYCRPMRHMRALPRGVPNRCAGRAARARCNAVPVVPDHRAQGIDPSRAT